MFKNKKEIGNEGEDIAVKYLTDLGYSLLERNWKTGERGSGEIDIIMTKGVVIVFIEVKYRRQGRFGYACDAISEHKKSRLYQTAQSYLISKGYGLDTECLFSALLIDDYLNYRNISFIENIFA